MNGIYFALVLTITSLLSSLAYSLDANLYMGVSGGDATYKNNTFVSGQAYSPAKDDPAYSLTAGLLFNKLFLTEFVYSNFNTETHDSISCSFSSSCKTVNYNTDIETYAVYAGLRTSKPLYFIIKLGYVYGESEFSDPFQRNSGEILSGISFAVGTGVKMGDFHFTVQETNIKSSIHYTSLGLSYHF